VAGEVVQDARVVHQGLHGDAEARIFLEDLVFLFQLGGNPVHFAFQCGGFHSPEAVQAPSGGDHLADEVEFDGVGGLEALNVSALEDLEAVLGLIGEDDQGGIEAVLYGVQG
jgi:hypothetical protein